MQAITLLQCCNKGAIVWHFQTWTVPRGHGAVKRVHDCCKTAATTKLFSATSGNDLDKATLTAVKKHL